MKNTGVLYRVRRAFKCQFKHLCTRILDSMDPLFFFKCPKLVTALWHASQKGFLPRFNHPRDIDELLMSLNLKAMEDEKERAIRIKCADKYAVRDYVRSKGYGSILNECYGIFNRVEEIDFESLPESFVLKLTNGSGQNFICRDKKSISFSELKKTLQRWLEIAPSFGLKTGEWHYSQIQPRIIAEKYLASLGEGTSIIDYKFQCFNGKILGILVCYDRDPVTHRVNYDWYDPQWNLTDGEPPRLHRHQRLIPKPDSFDEMSRIAKDLSAGINHVRIDFYEIDGTPSFGEMTFTEGGNIMDYSPWVRDAMFRQLSGSEK